MNKTKIPGPEQGFTSRVWKVLGASTEPVTVDGKTELGPSRDGYRINGGEIRCAALLQKMELVDLESLSAGRRLTRATKRGAALYVAYLAERGA
jgi:hypothetical protein